MKKITLTGHARPMHQFGKVKCTSAVVRLIKMRLDVKSQNMCIFYKERMSSILKKMKIRWLIVMLANKKDIKLMSV
jgi:hypothetical protein